MIAEVGTHAGSPQLPLYGLIGYPLGHSFSPEYFRGKFAKEGIAARYDAFPIECIEFLSELLKAHPDLRGLNVTTPYKQAVMPLLSACSTDALEIGAVNCIAIENGRMKGYNTDWQGFRDSFGPLLSEHHQLALILGNGGASLAVRYALKRMNIAYHTVSATPGKADFLYRDVDEKVLGAHRLIVNTTTLGTLGEGCPLLPYSALSPDHLLYDLVYNPALTPFLEKGQLYGAAIRNGREMLELQAEASWRIWQTETG